MSQKSSLPNQIDFLHWVFGKWTRKTGIAIGVIYVFVGLYSKWITLKVLDEHASFGHLFNQLKPQAAPSLFEFLSLLPLPLACAMVKLPQWLLDRPKENSHA